MAVFADGQGRPRTIALADVVRAYQPNAMGLAAKVGHYLAKIWELLTAKPRESNTEGGLFPAIFGTVMLIFLMAMSCFPLGVLAGVYLGEYAREGVLVRLVRIAVNNLAGIPSIVYGIFGLGFFVYGVGAQLDQWFYPERVAAGSPTFGTGGILWASLTLGLLTVPVVIVATEEAIRAIPRSVRESSYALGATKFQTLLRVLLPLASPGIMTGFILAMARAAGEVAPLMITGVVKLAPTLPAGREVSLLPPGPQVHAPGVPHLRHRFPVAQRRGHQAHGLRDDAVAGADRAADEQPGHLLAQPHEKATSDADDLRAVRSYDSE